MQVGIASDHGGFALKEELVGRLRAAGHEVMDFGAHALHEDDDYPDFVIPLGRAVAAGTVERGVAICGSGVGAWTPGVTCGRIRRDWFFFENFNVTFASPAGTVSAKDQTGWSPAGGVIVMRILEPAR